ncbi:hypothetical protein NDK50_08170 [Paraburkholderia bryophila]|uniref:hypothetical protein n=1 Tax=Paraburkholderia bryophila TaxID=420952 RepID=UPI00234AF02A|nr:hypothetical protein [Paraburkholderia bryophila]WCM21412.1 hypothetical protein NDK50_08170 [Paraburkholderia bryophila]
MEEKKYGGYTVPQIREFLNASEESGEGLDSFLGDGAIAAEIIGCLLEELEGK